MANPPELAGLDGPVPGFSSLCRCQKTLTVNIPYPDLLGRLRVERPNQVRCADITDLHAWDTGTQAWAGIGRWITIYNHQRPDAAHGGQPPAVAYFNPSQTDQQVQAEV